MTGAAPLTVLVVEDEPRARAGLRQLIAADPELRVVGEAADGLQAMAALERQRPDLLLLDVEMPGVGGLEVLRALAPERAPVVVMITAHERYALAAFDGAALDYLLKPFTDDRFRQAMERAKLAVGARQAAHIHTQLLALLAQGEASRAGGTTAAPSTGAALLRRFAIRKGRDVLLLPVESVDWIAAQGFYVRLHGGGGSHLLRGTLGSLMPRLDPQRFARISRSAAVNLERVRRVLPGPRGGAVAELEGGLRLPVSASRRATFETALVSG